jgi:hypothetical protein
MHMRLLSLVLAPVVGVLTACGGHTDLAHPTGHGDVVVRVESGAGMGTRESFFSDIPDLVLTGDGTTYVAMQETEMRGIVSPVVRFTAPDGALDSLLERANHDHLLGDPPDYSSSGEVSDGGDTRVTLSTNQGTWAHTANALDAGASSRSTARARLADFVGYATRWSQQVHMDHSVRDYAPVLRVMATPLPETDDPKVDVATWPVAAEVDLADLGNCSVVDDATVVRSLTTRRERAYRQGGATYSVAAAVLLPGESCPS